MINNVGSELLQLTYDEFLERLKIEIGDFFVHAEAGKTVRHQGLKARKDSMKLRKLFKMYRPISIRQEQRINEIMREAKKTI